MCKFSERSLKKLNACDDRLIRLMSEAIKHPPFDFSIICGYRGEEEQNTAYDKGNSKLKFPQSMHNKSPSLAIDIVPYPVDWNDLKRFKVLSWHIKLTAYKLNIDIDWGGDWKTFKDYPHWQLV